MLIDSHAHLYMRFDHDLPEVVQRCREENLRAIVVIGAGEKIQSNLDALRLAEEYDFIRATVAVHPHDAALCNEEVYDQCASWAEKHPEVVAIGETGLDFHYNLSPPDDQRKAFRRFIGMARDLHLPLVIHDREAHEECLTILKEEHAEEVGGIVHCFSGDVRFARQVIDLGFSIGMGGVVTFKNAKDLQEVAKEIDLEQMVLETDCPFLAPVPHRGKRNEPWMIRYVAAKIAQLRDCPLEEVIEATGANSNRIYRLGLQ